MDQSLQSNAAAQQMVKRKIGFHSKRATCAETGSTTFRLLGFPAQTATLSRTIFLFHEQRPLLAERRPRLLWFQSIRVLTFHSHSLS